MTTEKTKIIERLVEEFWNQGNLAVADELLTPDFVNHDPVNPEVTNLEAYKQWASVMHKAFPDFHVTVEDTIVEGDKVVKRWTVTGTQKGEIMGIPPTGKQINIQGIAIYRFAGDKIAEIWWGYDALGMLGQLGAFPPKE
ncbi:ester cyclase [Thermococcus sp. M39]|uniref:ester cyclase n=1 Tax=unclassified Thermococcus TaxID=2627626 RepID=UPI00143C55D8|nr:MULTISPECIES: ester cyclase [unclassified Thermococcus]NJE08836.1 ester cyclase [Thermococcus sp. M39]NJE13497.1 ester cyclase [Thermococcus sp. LS2]